MDLLPEPPPRGVVVWTVLEVAAAGALLWALYLARQVLVLVYISALLAIGISPFVSRIERLSFLRIGRHRPPRWVAALVIYLVVLFAVGALGYAGVPPLVRQARAFMTNLPQIVERAERYLVARRLLAEPLTFGELIQQSPPGTDTVATVLLTIWGVFGGLLGTVTILILTFYLLVDADAIFLTFVRLFPRHRRLHVRAVCDRISGKVSGWLNGQLILGGTIGAAVALELGFLGVPYFFVLAVIAAVGELVPYIGPILSAIPAIGVALSISPQLALVVALLYLINQQVESQVLVPQVMERQLGLSAVAVMVALLVGGALLGVVGVILAAPSAAIAQVMFQELVTDDVPEPTAETAGRLP